jgi:hypothetical protein
MPRVLTDLSECKLAIVVWTLERNALKYNIRSG